jgi:hypothetical protein
MTGFWEGVASEWCRLTHGGGHILRDPSDRVNWQCAKCGRWAEPVGEADEKAVTDRASERFSAVRRVTNK